MRLYFAASLMLVMPSLALARNTPLHVFGAVAIAPDGKHVAAIDSPDSSTDTAPPASLRIYDRAGHAVLIQLPCTPGPECRPTSPVWNHDGSRVAFIVETGGQLSADVETVDAQGGTPKALLHFDGPLTDLRYGPNDALAVLATANAHKAVGRVEAGAPQTGVIGDEIDEQRIGVIAAGSLRFISPADLYVYEYDWRPDGGFVGTAAHGDGDANWWIARLYAFNATGGSRVLYTPAPREQLASPRVSPDGRSVAFIGGWMSDFGSTGGDAYIVALDQPHPMPANLTPNAPQTVTAIDWHCGPGLTGTTLQGDQQSVIRLDHPGAPPLWKGTAGFSAGGWNLSLSCSPQAVAAVGESFTGAPEIVAGPIGAWHAITHFNQGQTAPLMAHSITWKDDGLTVQGWLLTPPGGQPIKRPLIVVVHGGPEAAVTPSFPAPRGTLRAFLAQGWDVLLPNYRGSYGEGEAFASASIGDLGGGDWRDVLGGVDAAEAATPIDDRRLAITGGSYGGYMTMWAVTQTHRFRAGAADAGVSDWLSIEGEAPQPGSDQVNFGGSVYDDAQPYLRASPIMHMRGVVTPVLITVGERDEECPEPQSLEFYTAMLAVGAPTQFVVYPGEGHELRREADRDDLQRRTVAWFQRWFQAAR